ncbi:MAG: starvation protein A [Cardiobacteriaceae bacterium]|nr:starvation protein A [Cardiobacteriaceae bacterium]
MIKKTHSDFIDDDFDLDDKDADLSLGSLVLYSSPRDIFSHRIRLISSIKKLEITIQDIDLSNPDVRSSYMTLHEVEALPLISDHNFRIYGDRVLAEYLDERFPHPNLMPIEASKRAIIRLFCSAIEDSWYHSAVVLEHDIIPNKNRLGGKKPTAAEKNRIRKELIEEIKIFFHSFKAENYGKFLMNDELNLVDCSILPILWRLGACGIELPDNASWANTIRRYMKHHFEQEYFLNSLSRYERELPQLEADKEIIEEEEAPKKRKKATKKTAEKEN